MKKILLLCYLILLITTGLFSLPVDPSDDIYRYLDLWRKKGYIVSLPAIRPYPHQVLINLLGQVENCGNSEARKNARSFLAKLVNKPQVFAVSPYQESFISKAGHYSGTGVDFSADGLLKPWLSISARGGGLLESNSLISEDVLPYGVRLERDMHHHGDEAKIGNFEANPAMVSIVAFGTEEFYFQTGFNRTAFGPFLGDSVVVSEDAPHAGHFSLTWNGKKANFTKLLLALTAQTNSGTGVYNQKYLSLTSLDWQFASWGQIGYVGSIVYGGYLDPVYFIPLTDLMYQTLVQGDKSNSHIGLYGSLYLPAYLTWDLIFYADDLHFNDIVTFNWNTRWKFVLQSALSWSPGGRIFKDLGLEYTMVTPYTYTHPAHSYEIVGVEDTWGPATVNYLNYTHAGQNLGVSLPPNSMRLVFKSWLTPSPELGLDLRGSWQVCGEGDILNHGWDNGTTIAGDWIFDSWQWLTDNILSHYLQAGFDLSWKYPLGMGVLRLTAGYTFQYGWNRRGDGTYILAGSAGTIPITEPKAGNNGADHFLSLSASWTR